MSGPWDHDPFVMATLLALATGFASLEDPLLGPLTLTLVALAVAARLVHLRSANRSRGVPREEIVGISMVALAAVLYALAPSPIDAVRGPILAVSLLPLWWAVRRPRGDPGAFA